jgi:hypothetical protein
MTTAEGEDHGGAVQGKEERITAGLCKAAGVAPLLQLPRERITAGWRGVPRPRQAHERMDSDWFP